MTSLATQATHDGKVIEFTVATEHDDDTVWLALDHARALAALLRMSAHDAARMTEPKR